MFIPKISSFYKLNKHYYYELTLKTQLPLMVINITHSSNLPFGGVFDCSLYYEIFLYLLRINPPCLDITKPETKDECE